MTFSVPGVKRFDDTSQSDIVWDYKEHWPELDNVIQFLVAGQFTSAPQEAVLQIKHVSNWGATMFTTAATQIGGVLKLCNRGFGQLANGKPARGIGTDYVPDPKFTLCDNMDDTKAAGSVLSKKPRTVVVGLWNGHRHIPMILPLGAVVLFTPSHLADINIDGGVTVLRYTDRKDDNIRNRELFEKGASDYVRECSDYVCSQIVWFHTMYAMRGELATKTADEYIAWFHRIYRHK
jgi:hypothetical protein